jgi:hypothetical protein
MYEHKQLISTVWRITFQMMRLFSLIHAVDVSLGLVAQFDTASPDSLPQEKSTPRRSCFVQF